MRVLSRQTVYKTGPVRPPEGPAQTIRRPMPESVGLLTKARRLKAALQEWHRAGRPITSRAGRKLRAKTCGGCAYFRQEGNLGLGECRAPGCGCTRGKIWLATSVCPLGKWAAERRARPVHRPRKELA